MASLRRVALNTGASMPALGLGTFQATVPGEVGAAVKAAIKCAPLPSSRALLPPAEGTFRPLAGVVSDRHWPETGRPRADNRAPPAQPAQSGRKAHTQRLTRVGGVGWGLCSAGAGTG